MGRAVPPALHGRRCLIVWMEIFWLILMVGALVMLIPIADRCSVDPTTTGITTIRDGRSRQGCERGGMLGR
ncbi:hypothetical protein GS482_08450 [Rhodococcus hoagii]|nr:hypothetical protein [Prescottella equi]MBM4632232.1 hypothetical protein [Prescottella equi]